MPDRSKPRARHVAAILLAAGRSERFGGRNKLLAPVAGQPMVRRAVQHLMASRADPVIVVTGFEHGEVEAALEGLAVRFVHNPGFAEGLASSICAGLAAVPDDADAALICLGDMPGARASIVDELIMAFAEAGDAPITFPQKPDGAQGNPVLWPRRHFSGLMALTGDRGAKALIGSLATETLPVPMTSAAPFDDIDTEAELAALDITDDTDGSGL